MSFSLLSSSLRAEKEGTSPLWRLTRNGTFVFILIIFSSTFLPACSPTASPSPQPSATRIAADLGPTSTHTPIFPTFTAPPPAPTLVPIPPISELDWTRGPSDAQVTLLIYSDFQCPHCAKLKPVLQELESRHPEDLRIYFRHFPLKIIHDKASLAGQAAEAAGNQGAFWEMHDILFDRQAEWTNLAPSDFKEWLKMVALELAIDQEQFIEEIESEQYAQFMEENFQSGMMSGLAATPSIFVNGTYYQLEPTLSMLEASIRLELLEALKEPNYPVNILAPEANYLATLHLNIGEVIVQLYPDAAPLAVNSFISLAEKGWYDDNPIFRVVPGKFVESGDPSGTGFGDPGFHFDIETDPALKFDEAGMVAISNVGPNTNGSRFFISLAALPEFDGTRTIFGRVIEGLDLLTELETREPLADLLNSPEAIILSVTIEEQ